MNNLVTLHSVQRALASARRPDEALAVMHACETMQDIARRAKRGWAEQMKWAEWRLRAERKLGEILPDHLIRHRPKISVDEHDTFRLADYGISRDLVEAER